jgi:hypothetical protein
MKTLKQRLHPQYKKRLTLYQIHYPTLGERINENLNNLEFIGDLRLTVLIDMQQAFKLKNVTDVYDIFDEQTTNY